MYTYRYHQHARSMKPYTHFRLHKFWGNVSLKEINHKGIKYSFFGRFKLRELDLKK